MSRLNSQMERQYTVSQGRGYRRIMTKKELSLDEQASTGGGSDKQKNAFSRSFGSQSPQKYSKSNQSVPRRQTLNMNNDNIPEYTIEGENSSLGREEAPFFNQTQKAQSFNKKRTPLFVDMTGAKLIPQKNESDDNNLQRVQFMQETVRTMKMHHVNEHVNQKKSHRVRHLKNVVTQKPYYYKELSYYLDSKQNQFQVTDLLNNQNKAKTHNISYKLRSTRNSQ